MIYLQFWSSPIEFNKMKEKKIENTLVNLCSAEIANWCGGVCQPAQTFDHRDENEDHDHDQGHDQDHDHDQDQDQD